MKRFLDNLKARLQERLRSAARSLLRDELAQLQGQLFHAQRSAAIYGTALQEVRDRARLLEPWARENRGSCPELLAWGQFICGRTERGFADVHPFDRWGIFPKPESVSLKQPDWRALVDL